MTSFIKTCVLGQMGLTLLFAHNYWACACLVPQFNLSNFV